MTNCNLTHTQPADTEKNCVIRNSNSANAILQGELNDALNTAQESLTRAAGLVGILATMPPQHLVEVLPEHLHAALHQIEDLIGQAREALAQ